MSVATAKTPFSLYVDERKEAAVASHAGEDPFLWQVGTVYVLALCIAGAAAGHSHTGLGAFGDPLPVGGGGGTASERERGLRDDMGGSGGGKSMNFFSSSGLQGSPVQSEHVGHTLPSTGEERSSRHLLVALATTEIYVRA